MGKVVVAVPGLGERKFIFDGNMMPISNSTQAGRPGRGAAGGGDRGRCMPTGLGVWPRGPGAGRQREPSRVGMIG